MKPKCKNCAWRSYNIVKSEFFRPAYMCLNEDSWKYRQKVSLRSSCKEFEYEPERLAS